MHDIRDNATLLLRRGGAAVGRWTGDLQVAGLNPSRSAFT